MTHKHPYTGLPRHANWRRAMADVPMSEVDPALNAPFRLKPGDRVATAGSCFAQHIARQLKSRGFNYLVTEEAHPLLPPELARQFNYGVFSARFGNLYTTRQLWQLFERAHGRFQPQDDAWPAAHGHWIDPYRPQVQPDGFASRREFDVDRARHLAAVRRMFETLDVFVFTLGLTEAWRARSDGAVYPVCPGVSGGEFDPALHEFHNDSVDDVRDNMLAFIDGLRAVNPRARVILTVSPVPLIATAEDRHVLVSTTYSKAALRVASEQICQARPDVGYFPSYEIITGAHSRGAYFGDDLRTVTEAGVQHVMRLFIKHWTERPGAAAEPEVPRTNPPNEAFLHAAAAAAELNCDEAALDKD